MMDFNKIKREMTENIAMYIDAKDQVSERVAPHLIDHSRWKEKYLGLDNQELISLNTFRYEVDTVVASLMSVILENSE